MRLQKVTYGAGPTALTFDLPARPWVPGTVGIGAGREESASGIPSVWYTRRDRSLHILQRFTESQWSSVRAFLDHAQAGGSFAWFPDSADATSYTCYLVAPRIDEDVRPTRGEYFGSMELLLTIRRTDGGAIDEVYFDG